RTRRAALGEPTLARQRGRSSPISSRVTATSEWRGDRLRALPSLRPSRGRCEQRMELRRRRPAAPVRTGDDLQQVAVRIVEIDAATTVPIVDAAGLPPEGIRTVGELACANPGEDRVEFLLVHEERVVLRRDLVRALGEVSEVS